MGRKRIDEFRITPTATTLKRERPRRLVGNLENNGGLIGFQLINAY
jgi:hypothetical protein